MLSLSKYWRIVQDNRNSFSKLFSRFILIKEYDGQLRRYNYYVSIENKSDGNNLRALTTQTILKPTKVVFSTEDQETFAEYLSIIIKDLVEDETYSNVPEVVNRFSHVLKYNLPNGTKILGLSTLLSYRMLEKPEKLTKDAIKLANVLGWCNELLAISTLLVDDIMDNSDTRRNAPCWYRVKGIGLTAINDAFFLENSVYAILKKYFSTHPMYVPIMELFHDAYLKITYGQCLDTMRPKLEEITIDRFNKSTMYKTGYYTLLVPVILGMYLSDTYSVELHKQIEPILLAIGRYMQVENDMWDCFGDASVTGKIGTDIQQGIGTWLAAVALQKSSPLQRKLMVDHYGRPEKESVEIIRNLYEELDIPNDYISFREENFKNICSDIREITSNEKMRALLFTLIETLFNRKYE